MHKTKWKAEIRAAAESVGIITPRIVLEGTQMLLLERHCGIQQYEQDRLLVSMGSYMVQITGSGLVISAMDHESLRIRGTIASVALQEDGR